MSPSLPNAASVALIRGGEVLLIQRARAPFQHLWTLPGGRVEPGETAEACARREITEEVGVRIERIDPVVQLVLAEGRYLLQVYVSTRFDGRIVPSDEILAHRWIVPAGIGALATTPELDMVLARAFAITAGGVAAPTALR